MAARSSILTEAERLEAERQLRWHERPPRRILVPAVIFPGVVGAFAGFILHMIGTAASLLPANVAFAYAIPLGCSIAGLVVGYRSTCSKWRDFFEWDHRFLTELLSGPRLNRLRVRAKRLAVVQIPSRPKDIQGPGGGLWMFAELGDGRVLSVGGTGPICLDQRVRPCEEFEMVIWPERRTYVFFHVLSEPPPPIVEFPAEAWNAGIILPGEEVEGGWDALPEFIRQGSLRAETEDIV